MASMKSEVLDPSAGIERLRKAAEELALSRRNFLVGGAAGVAVAGAGLFSATHAAAQEPSHNGYAQTDVLNFLLQVKYLTATFYSFVTQGKDLPAAATVGAAQVYNAPGKVTFTGVTNGPSAQEITDLFNEVYYDELNHVIDLRNLIESAAAGQAVGGTPVTGRPNINLAGNSTAGTTPSSTTETLSAAQAISLAQWLEDLTVSASIGAAVYLTGTNLAYVTQMMAADGFHSGAIRLIAIQSSAPYYYTGSQNFTFTAAGIAGSSTLYAFVSSSSPIQAGYQINTGATVPITADTNSNGGAGTLAYTGAPSAPGLGAVTATAVGTIPSSYSSGYTTANQSVHHENVLTDVPAAIAQTWAVGMPVYDSSGYFFANSANGVYIVSITPNPAPATTYSVQVSASSGGHAPGTIYVGTTPITLSAPLPNSGVFAASTIGIPTSDSNDVVPADLGAGLATTGPAQNSSLGSGFYGGFFDTAGSGTASANNPAGLAFGRSFSQVLSVLLNYNPATSTNVNQTYEGGFFPYGIGGTINAVQSS